MSSSSLLRFLLVTATFCPAVETYEENNVDASSSRFDMVGGGVMVRVGGRVEIRKKGNEKKEKNGHPRTSQSTQTSLSIDCIYIVAFDRRFFPNGRLLETYFYIAIYIYIYIPTNIYHIPLHYHYIRYNVYIVAAGLQF